MKKSWLVLGLVFVLSSLLALLFQDFLREVMVKPLLYAYWFVRLYLESLPQSLLWALFIGAATAIIAKSLSARKARSTRQRRALESEHQGKIETWVERIRLARRGNYFNVRLARRLAELSLEALAYRERQTPGEIREQLENGMAQVPEEIQEYLTASLALDVPNAISEFANHLGRIRKASPLQLNPERLVRFLENLLQGRREGERI